MYRLLFLFNQSQDNFEGVKHAVGHRVEPAFALRHLFFSRPHSHIAWGSGWRYKRIRIYFQFKVLTKITNVAWVSKWNFSPLILVVLGIFYLCAQIYCLFSSIVIKPVWKKSFSSTFCSVTEIKMGSFVFTTADYCMDEKIAFHCIEKIRNSGESEKKHNMISFLALASNREQLIAHCSRVKKQKETEKTKFHVKYCDQAIYGYFYRNTIS